MKSFAAFLVAAAIGARTGVRALDASTLPVCCQSCLKDMVGKAESYGCSKGSNYACLCKAQDFIYGIRDCSREACGGDSPALVTFIVDTCKHNGVEVTALDGTVPTDAGNGNASQGSNGNSNKGPVTGAGTSTQVTVTVTQNGSTFLATLESTVAPDFKATPPSSSSSTDEPEKTSGNAEPTSTEDKTHDSLGATPSESSEEGTAQKSAAPVGILAAAGIAALLI